MDQDRENLIDESRSLFADGALERVRRVELVRRLLKHRDDPRVVEILKQRLADEDDPEVLKTVILGLGFVKDRQVIELLKPFLEHSSMRVNAAAIKTLCRLNPNMEVQALHPLLTSRDEKARLAAVLALFSNSKRLGAEMVAQLSSSPVASLRHTAVACLEAMDKDEAARLALAMFRREADLELIKELARALARGMQRELIEEMNAFRAELKAAREEDPERDRLRTVKIEFMDRISRRSYKAMDLSAGKIGMLEGQVDRQAGRLENAKEQEDHAREAEQRARQEERRTALTRAARARPPWKKIFGGFAAVVALSGATRFAFQAGQPPPPAVVAPPEAVSNFGKRGDRVSVDGEVLHVYRVQNSVAITGQGLMLLAVCPAGVPPLAEVGTKVHVEGPILAVKGKTSFSVTAEKITRGY